MTLKQLDAARLQTVQMFRNFGDSESAAEFEQLTAEQYAARQGIEIVASNPNKHAAVRLRRGVVFTGRRTNTIMATESKRVAELERRVADLEDTLRDGFDLLEDGGTTRADREETETQLRNLFVDALPALEDEDDDEDEDDEEENEE
jgi:hypothetical protein